MDKTLYFGDNLDILRQHIQDESVDLIYLDPPFNSNASYNVLFKEPTGEPSRAQIEAFLDTWHWTEETEATYREIVKTAPPQVVEMITAFRKFIRRNDMLAYLVMMTIRLIELRRVLKPTGSVYLHCDPTASHYLKVVMDTIFGVKHFQNEIIWNYRRWPTKANRFQRMHDVVLFYTKSEDNYFNALFQEATESTKRRWGTKKQKVEFDEFGARLPTQELEEESKGVLMDDVWDISIIAPSSKERMGYQTQKPRALLERIIKASAPENGIVLDPFCGCGTTISACEQLNLNEGYRLNWVGIDITHLAIKTIKRRLDREYDFEQDKDYEVIGEPKDTRGAITLADQDRFQFEWWALSLIDAQPFNDRTKGADTGIDGMIYFIDYDKPKEHQKAIVQVKSGKVQVRDIRELKAVVEREQAQVGIFLTLKDPTRSMIEEAVKAGFYKDRIPKIQIITIGELLRGEKSVQIIGQVDPWKTPKRAIKTAQRLSFLAQP